MPREDGYKNLIPFSERTEEEARTLGQKGGEASGVSRRRKKSLKEAADLFLSLPVTDTRTFSKMVKAGLNTDEIDYQMAVIVGLTMQAAKGDAKAAKAVFDLLGEIPDDDGGKKQEQDHSALIEAIKNMK